MKDILFIFMFSLPIIFGTHFYLLNPKKMVHRLNAIVIYLAALLVFSEYYIYNCESPTEFFYHNHNHTILIGLIGMLECICIWYFCDPFKDHPKKKPYTKWFLVGIISSFILVFPLAIFTDQAIIVLNEKLDGKWGFYIRTETWVGKSFIAWYFILISIVVALFYSAYRRSINPKIKRWNFLLFVVFSIVSIAMFVIFVFLPSSFAVYPGRYEIGGFLCIGAVALSWVFANFKLFDVTPVSAINDILSSVSNLIILTDHSFYIKYNNNVAERSLCLSDHISSSKTILNLLDEVGTVDAHELLLKVNQLRSGERYEFSFTSNFSDTPKHYFFVVTKLIKSQDLHAGYTFVGVDVSSLIEKENELRNYNEELEKKNLELERFAYVASHDLKTPLRNITSFLSLLRRSLKDHKDENVKDYMDIVQSYAKNMYNLIEEILEYSRIESGKLDVVPTDMNEVLQLIEKNLSDYIETKNAIIQFESLPTILANQTQIIQLFQNIIENGLKYNNNKIPLVIVSSYQESGGIVFRVDDNGIGISSEYHEKIFEIFKRLHNQTEYNGSGVGLAICKKIAGNHGGTITLESKEENGSSFFIRLEVRVIEKRNLVLERMNN